MLKKLLINGRNELGLYLNQLQLHGIGVEVGTHRGEFANEILMRWAAGTLYCVDPWENLPEYASQVQFLWDSESRQQDLQYAQQLLQAYADRVRYMQMTSADAVTSFDDGSLDFVYLDGNHMEPYVSQDLQLWWPKVKPGGLLLGHDVLMPGVRDDPWDAEIQPAVLKFAAQHDDERIVYLIPEDGVSPWSYCIHK